jgi:hypothetical protein
MSLSMKDTSYQHRLPDVAKTLIEGRRSSGWAVG